MIANLSRLKMHTPTLATGLRAGSADLRIFFTVVPAKQCP